MVSTQRRSRSSRSDVASRLLMAKIPVSGVAHLMREGCERRFDHHFRLDRGAQGRRGFTATAGRPVFFGRRFFGQPCTSPYARFLPPWFLFDRAWNQNGMAGLGESRSGFLWGTPGNYGDSTRRRMSAGVTPFARNSRRAGGAGRFRQLFARWRRGPADDAGSRAGEVRADFAAGDGRWSTRTGPAPRTTSVTPCRASSIATDR